ncbi:MAG: DUF1444 family protein [Anaerolineae bacterium]|nr:DUF1444 family protein [Anaerolineae bacterium]
MLTRNAFKQHLKKATEQAGYTVDDKQKKELTVIMHGQPMKCNLDMLYSGYQNAPERLDDIVEAHLAALKKVPPPLPPITEKEAAESLLPLLQSQQWLNQANENKEARLISQPYKAGLCIVYVFDQPQYRAYIHTAMMPDVPPNAIHEIALNNLRRRTSAKLVQTQGTGDDTLIVCETSDGFAATRILLPELMATWHERVPGKMLLGIPNRDFLIAFSDRNSEKTAVIQQIRADFKHKPNPLTPDLFTWQLGQIREYAPKQ